MLVMLIKLFRCKGRHHKSFSVTNIISHNVTKILGDQLLWCVISVKVSVNCLGCLYNLYVNLTPLTGSGYLRMSRKGFCEKTLEQFTIYFWRILGSFEYN